MSEAWERYIFEQCGIDYDKWKLEQESERRRWERLQEEIDRERDEMLWEDDE